MKIDFKKKIANLELCPNTYIDGRESDSLEICQWSDDDTYKWTIASFEYDKKEDCLTKEVTEYVIDKETLDKIEQGETK